MLDPEDIERIAARTAEVVAERSQMPQVFTAAELAAYLGVSTDLVYSNSDQLGGVRIGDGRRPTLRFVIDRAELDRWRGRQPIRIAKPPPKPTPHRVERVPLLRIRPETNSDQ